ncbi:hypothetical protein DSOUD_3428 [Desulfuromonas soudanensis]|uniref:Lipoprotein n=1 Tax=Desulfuromonas soudanensis TaxID=1603606 RepID=A0A0M4DL85_9BACT|nr:hypothetical protein [Desulfuromonas soudanensis]ALC18145.1 hypothetical protein DSOUD_3428 [Desulfuromonas soudanensis]
MLQKFFRRTPRLAPLFALFFLCSCGVMARSEADLTRESRDFSQRLRWGDFQGAARHLADPYRDDFLALFQGISDLQIVDVRVEKIDQPLSELEGEVEMVLEYYQLPSIRVKEFRFRQLWRYEGGTRYHAGLWQVVSPFPPFP